LSTLFAAKFGGAKKLKASLITGFAGHKKNREMTPSPAIEEETKKQ